MSMLQELGIGASHFRLQIPLLHGHMNLKQGAWVIAAVVEVVHGVIAWTFAAARTAIFFLNIISCTHLRSQMIGQATEDRHRTDRVVTGERRGDQTHRAAHQPHTMAKARGFHVHF